MKFERLAIAFLVALALGIWAAAEFSESSVSSHQKSIPSSSPPGIAEVVFEATDGEVTKLQVPLKAQAIRRWSDDKVNFLQSDLSSQATLHVCLESFEEVGDVDDACINGVRNPDHPPDLIIRIFANNIDGYVHFTKVRNILPPDVPRNFDTICGLMKLGVANDYKGKTVGRVFRRQPDGSTKESWSQFHYYIPEDEDNWPEFHMWCTNRKNTLMPQGICVATSQISRHVYIDYQFKTELLEHWQRVDQFAKEIVYRVPVS
ncbi:hypothetical protein [Kordiimonas sp.]|uniref:hypothetical protein n=1 Tax=Kordiimonas sp. TaxID=1970157 RepID=UPI003B52B373